MSTFVTDGKIGWVGVWIHGWLTGFSLSEISGLIRPKNVKFGTSASSTRRILTLRFLGKKF